MSAYITIRKIILSYTTAEAVLFGASLKFEPTDLLILNLNLNHTMDVAVQSGQYNIVEFLHERKIPVSNKTNMISLFYRLEKYAYGVGHIPMLAAVQAGSVEVLQQFLHKRHPQDYSYYSRFDR